MKFKQPQNGARLSSKLTPKSKGNKTRDKHKRGSDALLSSLLDPLEGLSVLNCEKLELGAAPDF